MGGAIGEQRFLRGVVRGGRIEMGDGVRLPEGTVVQITPIEMDQDSLLELVGEAVSTGISDLATQHDHYLYGLAKPKD